MRTRMALLELDAHTWRAVALLLPNPTAFAACCKRASQAVRDEEFRFHWFSAHHRGRAPHRPWQYAALTWQLHRRAQPEQIVAFILRFHDWSQQQRQQPTAAHANTAAAVQRVGPGTAAPTAPAGAASRAARARSMLLPMQRNEGYCTLPMECRLLPSAVRRAQQLLAKGRTLDALYHVCPASTSLLFAYAAKSRNHGLMQQLLKHKDTLLGCAVFPEHWFVGCAGGMHLRLGLSCSCAALAGGDLPMLRQLLLFGGSLAWTWRGRLLLRYAARHSSAECLQELLFVCQVDGSLSCRGLPLVAPQHLTMAASRNDAWAAGVVQKLLQALTPKQRKSSHMRPAYKAACSSGCAPVLQLLLGVAAATQQQLQVLLEAAAVAGNLQAWRQLLLQSGSNNQQQQREGVAEAAAFQHIDWSFLTVQQLARTLHLVLPNTLLAGVPPGTTQQVQWQAAEGACRLQMADLLWQVLVLQQGKEAELRQFLHGQQPPANGVHSAEAAAAKPSHSDSGVNGMLLSFDMAHFCTSAADRVLWLQLRGLIPEQQLHGAGMALEAGIGAATDAGDFARALRLHQAWGRLSAAPPQRPNKRKFVACCSIGGHLHRACAAGDAAAVVQLERLSRFAERVFSIIHPLNETLQHRVLLRTLLGRFMGRATTMSCLAEELGLPWQLLERLLVTNARAKAGIAVLQGKQHVQLEKDLSEVYATLQLAQDAELTPKLLRYGAFEALRCEIQGLGDDVEGVAAGQHQQLEAAGTGDAAAAAAAEPQAAGSAAAGDGAQQQEPPNPMQQLVNQLNAELQEQNQLNAQVNAALQQLQHMLQVFQQAGMPEEHIAQLAAQMANLEAVQQQQQQQQANAGQQEPEVLPQESMSRAELRRQLQQRLDAGERSIPLPQQAQLGPLPLWQQCLLELAAPCGNCLADGPHDRGLIGYLTSGMLVADSATGGADACTPLQRLLGDEAFAAGPPVALQPPRLPWGRLVAQAAVELRRPRLLAWALQPEQRQRLWGSARNAPKAALWDLLKQNCTPISNAVSNHPRQQAADMLQLRVHRQQHLPGQPPLAELAADTALLLLNVTPNEEGLLSDWLQHGLAPGSSEAHLVRAKAVLAAVVGAEQLPAGAQLMRRDCMKQVQRIGDVDLLALVVMWGHRMPD